MAEEDTNSQEKTEEPTEEKKTKFRNKGDIPVSKELNSVFTLFGMMLLLSTSGIVGFKIIKKFMTIQFKSIESLRINKHNLDTYLANIWSNYITIIIPIFLTVAGIAIFTTFAQTKFNFAWSKISPNFSKINPISGLKRILSGQALVELAKGIAKIIIISAIVYVIIFSERYTVPLLINYTMSSFISYWFEISRLLILSVSSCLLLIASLDYLYNFITIENRLKMTRQEMKEDLKQKDVDPLVKQKIRKMQRQLSLNKTIEATRDATVIITNPTHYSIALKYSLGMEAPILVAKGQDFVALEMRKIAKEKDIPIVENKPLARMLYASVDINNTVPEKFYKAISEIISYVFKIKGIKVSRS